MERVYGQTRERMVLVLHAGEEKYDAKPDLGILGEAIVFCSCSRCRRSSLIAGGLLAVPVKPRRRLPLSTNS